jgi:hypothetical protein
LAPLHAIEECRAWFHLQAWDKHKVIIENLKLDKNRRKKSLFKVILFNFSIQSAFRNT